VIENPNDRTDADKFDLTLVGANHGSLSLVGVPFPFAPWPVTRSTTGDVLPVPRTWDPQQTYTVDLPRVPPSTKMAAIFGEDQAARKDPNLSDSQRARVAEQDSARRKQTRDLLDAGELRAGEDFRKAAFVFQHGDAPEDFLVAHTLALVALSKGDREARWIAAATLDRYLTTVGKAQIYGTQFDRNDAAREPYNRTLVSDDVRRALGVPPIAEQLDQLRALKALRKDSTEPGRK
jgi:hypothetical protein